MPQLFPMISCFFGGGVKNPAGAKMATDSLGTFLPTLKAWPPASHGKVVDVVRGTIPHVAAGAHRGARLCLAAADLAVLKAGCGCHVRALEARFLARSSVDLVAAAGYV